MKVILFRSTMPTRTGIYLTWDTASEYLAAIDISNCELSRLQHRKVNGAQKVQLIIYAADDILRLANGLKGGYRLPDLENFLTRSQRSRHLSQQAKRRSALAYSPLRDYIAGKLSPTAVRKARVEVEDDEQDLAEVLGKLKLSRC